MKNNFSDIYDTLSKKEKEGFQQYMNSFYANHKTVLAVFEKLLQPNTEGGAFEDVLVGKAKNTQERKNVLNALSDLKNVLIEFLSWQSFKENNSIEAQFLTIDVLKKRALHAVASQKIKKLQAELDANENPDVWTLLTQWRLAHANYFNMQIDRLQYFKEDMDKLSYHLDSFFCAAKIKYSAESFSRKHIVGEEYNIPFLTEALTLSEQESLIHPIVTKLYLPTLSLTKNQLRESYYHLKSILRDNHALPMAEKVTILLYLLNYCIESIRKGQEVFYGEYFDITKIGLKHQLFTAYSYFPSESFLNIVNLGCYLKEYEWTEIFIKEWSLFLKKEDALSIKNLANARIAFETHQYDTVIFLLRTVKYQNFSFNLNARTLLIRACYEKKEDNELILDYLKALHLYVYRNKEMGKNMKTSVLNFVRVLRQFLLKKKNLLIELTDKREPILCLDWLKEKAGIL